MKIKKLLLASHGTPGARAAEDLALELCRESGAALFQLFIVPDFWKGMMGDDWLNNAVTRARFGDYVESQLAREAADEIARFAEKAEKAGISFTEDMRLGKPAASVIEACEQTGFDLVVIGSPRPKGVTGLRSRMDLEQLVRSLTTRLIIAPYPR